MHLVFHYVPYYFRVNKTSILEESDPRAYKVKLAHWDAETNFTKHTDERF